MTHGRESKNFKRFGAAKAELVALSFSLVLKKRTIDLQAFTQSDKEEFLDNLQRLIDQNA